MKRRTVDAERRLREELRRGARTALPSGTPETEIARLADDWYAGRTHTEAGKATPMETWLRDRKARNTGAALRKAQERCS